MNRWSRTREKGKRRYVLTRGMLIGDLLFAAWFGVTVSESMLSDIMRVSLIANKSVFFIRCLL